MPETDPSLNEKLADLRAAYLKGLPDRLRTLDTQLAHYFDQPQAENDKQVEIICHNLAGSAAAYGFQPIGACAKKLEEQVRSLVANPEGDPSGIREQITRDLQTLHALVETALKET